MAATTSHPANAGTTEIVGRKRRRRGNGRMPHPHDPGKVEMSEAESEAEIARLALISSLQYAQTRDASAKRLGISPGWLDKFVGKQRGNGAADTTQGEALEFPAPELWPDPVDGYNLVYNIRDLLQKHVVLPAAAGWVIAIWVLHTFMVDLFEHSPRLAITSPERGCGKTTLLDLLGRLVWRPLLAANLTAAATFRVIARYRSTLMIDEADSFLRDNEELRGVLNAGHRYDGYVLRVVGDDMEPRRFSVFSPVAISLIGHLPGTLHDRSIAVRMRRAGRTEVIEPIRKSSRELAIELVRQAARWTADNRARLAEIEPVLPVRMWNRVADNWRPLFAIAAVIGGELPNILTESAETLIAQGAADPQTLGVMLLQDIGSWFRNNPKVNRVASVSLVADLRNFDERPWSAFGKGDRPLTPCRLADLLRAFGIFSNTIRIGEHTLRGYLREQFEDAWARYLDPESDK